MQSPQQTSELVPTRFVWPYGGRQVRDESRRLVVAPAATGEVVVSALQTDWSTLPPRTRCTCAVPLQTG
jgi:hypothetical protein